MNINTRRRRAHARLVSARTARSYDVSSFVEINVRSADNKRPGVFVLPLSYWPNKLLPKVISIVSRARNRFFVLFRPDSSTSSSSPPSSLPPSAFVSRYHFPRRLPECSAHVRWCLRVVPSFALFHSRINNNRNLLESFDSLNLRAKRPCRLFR